MRKLVTPMAMLLAGFFSMSTVNLAHADTDAPVTLAQYYGGNDYGGGESYDYHPSYHHHYCHRTCYRQDYYGNCVAYHSYCD